MMRRIEDRSGNLGTFDVFCAWHGIAAWLELKFAGPRAKPDLRPGQAAFATNVRDAGVPCGYVVGSPDGSVRLLGPRCRGKSWDDDLIAQWPTLDVEAVLGALLKNGV